MAAAKLKAHFNYRCSVLEARFIGKKRIFFLW